MSESNETVDREIRDALRPHQVDADAFMASVEAKVKALEVAPPEEGLKRAAAVVPLSLVGAAGHATGVLKSSPSVWHKLLVFISWPAASVFVLLGVAALSARSMRNDRASAGEQSSNPGYDELTAWWGKHRLASGIFWVACLLPMFFGSSFFVLCLLNVSAVGLLFMIRSMSKAGHATRIMIGSYCTVGLFYLAMPLMFMSGPISREPHIVDPRWLPVILLLGAVGMPTLSRKQLAVIPGRRPRPTLLKLLLLSYAVFLGVTAISNATFRPAPILALVESFDKAVHKSASWQRWAVLSSWAIDAGYQPDLTLPRQLLARELENGTDPYTLASAMRGGLTADIVNSPAIDWDAEDAEWDKYVESIERGRAPSSGEQKHWLLRAAVERGRITKASRAALIRKTRERIQSDPVMAELVQLIEALDLLGGADDAEVRPLVHEHLRSHWVPEDSRILVDGGFSPGPYPGAGSDPVATYRAVALMKRFGVPEGIDREQVEWYLYSKSASSIPFASLVDVSVPRVAKASFAPLAPPVTLGRLLTLERSLFGALILVLLCYYATLSAASAVGRDSQE